MQEIAEIVGRLQALPGVEAADISVVYVPRRNGPPEEPLAPTIYIGIREMGRPECRFERPRPPMSFCPTRSWKRIANFGNLRSLRRSVAAILAKTTPMVMP